MRIDPHQSWHPVSLFQPLYNILLMALFEWGVAFHDMDFDAIRAGEKSKQEAWEDLKRISVKARAQIVKDYIAWPLVSGLVMTGIDLAMAAAGRDLNPVGVKTKSRRDKARAKASVAWHRARRRTRRDHPAVSAARQLVERRSFREPFRRTLWADVTANIIRNLWSHAIIFCGHFPDQTYTFSED